MIAEVWFIAVIASLLSSSKALPVTIPGAVPEQSGPQCDAALLSRVPKYEPVFQLTTLSFPFRDYNTSSDNGFAGDWSTAPAESTADEYLDIELDIPFCQSADDPDCLDLELSREHISSHGDEISDGYRLAEGHLLVQAVDRNDILHNVDLYTQLHTLALEVSNEVVGRIYRQSLVIRLDAIDNRWVEKQLITVTWERWLDHSGMSDLTGILFDKGNTLDIACLRTAFGLPAPATPATLEDHMAMDEMTINDEMHALQMLQEHALHLENEIKMRKAALAVAQARLHIARPLNQIIQDCEGMICAAQAVLTRINDKITLATTTETGYLESKHEDFLGNYEKISEPPSYESASSQTNTTSAHTFTGDFRTSESYLVKALTYIASILGVIALCSFIKRKCMSMRKRVERAADLEERRNARAYRRAARRAFIKQRWLGLFRSISCFSVKVEPERTTDYDEKRALILQDALLEQDFDQAEKGEVMEAQIRELRNAHHIVSSILQRRQPKPMNKDPPPPLVPLPHTPEARSRSSTSTLPSYDSASLPDYSSIPEPTGEHNATTDGFAHYVPSSSTSDQAHHSSRYSIHTRSTPISSIAGLSPRVSAETLRTRYSKVTDKS